MIYFEKIGEAYVQKGNYEINYTYVKGQHFVQGLGNVVADTTPQPVPQYWGATYNTLVSDPQTYDEPAYGIGIKRDANLVSVPRFQKVTLFYMVDTDPTYNSKTLVQYEGTDSAFVDTLSTSRFSNRAEYASFCGVRGFSQASPILDFFPPLVSKATVMEVTSVKGDFYELDGVTPIDTDVVVHVSPFWMNNSLPVFDLAYIVGDTAGLSEEDIAAGLITPRLFRIFGGFASENRAVMGYSDHSAKGGTGLAIEQGRTLDGQDRPTIPQQIVIDGVTYTNMDAYNVSRKLN